MVLQHLVYVQLHLTRPKAPMPCVGIHTPLNINYIVFVTFSNDYATKLATLVDAELITYEGDC